MGSKEDLLSLWSLDNMASAESANVPPPPAYQATPGSILHADKEFYTSVAQAGREQIESFVLPIRSGRAWKVPAGAIVRISTPEGPQVGDLNIWRLDNPRERSGPPEQDSFTPVTCPLSTAYGLASLTSAPYAPSLPTP